MGVIAETIKGINIVIGTETKALAAALGDVNKVSKDLQSELKQVEKLLKLDPGNTVLVAQKQKLLADAVENSKKKLDALKTAQGQVNAQFAKGDISAGQYRAFEREVETAEQQLKKLEAQGNETHKALSKEDAVNSLKKIGIAAGTAALAVGAMFVGMAGKAIENADELTRLADVTGLSAERLQELQYAGQNLGVEIETITGAQAKLTKSMYAARDGTGSQADAFAALGLSVVDANGNLRDNKVVMEEAFTALNGVGNETERDALSMQLFGKSAMELNPLIKAGGDELKRLTDEGRANGSVMSNEAVAGLDAFGDTMDNIKTSIMGSFGQMFADLLPQILGFVDNILLYWAGLKDGLAQLQADNQGFFDAIATIWADITSSIKDRIDQITAFWEKWGPTITAIVKPIWETIGVIIKTAMKLIGEIIALVLNVITGDWSGAWENIKGIAQAIWDGLTGIFEGLANTLKAIWSGIFQVTTEIWNNIKSFFVGWWDGIVAWVTGWDLWTPAAAAWESLKTNVIDVLSGLATSALEWGGNIVQGLVDGITDKLYAAKQAALDVATSISDALTNFFDSHSPSRLMFTLGVNIVQGLADGISENASVAVSAAESVATGILGWVNTALTALRNLASTVAATPTTPTGGGGGDDGGGSDEHDSPTFIRPPSGAQADISDDEINSTWAQSLRGTFRLLLREKINGTDSPDNSLYAKINNVTTREAWKTFDKYAANAWMGHYGFPYAGPLAGGGIATRATLGVFGEAGPEAILPLKNLLPMMTEALRGAISVMTPAQASVGGGSVVNLQVINKGTIVGSGGMQEFARTVSTEIARTTGLSMGGAW